MCELTQFCYTCHSHPNKREGRLLWYSTATGHCLAHQYISIHYGNDYIYGHIPQTLYALHAMQSVPFVACSVTNSSLRLVESVILCNLN